MAASYTLRSLHRGGLNIAVVGLSMMDTYDGSLVGIDDSFVIRK